MPKVLIAVPTFENIYPDVFKAIYNLRTGSYSCDFDFVRGYDCATARNNIARRALNGDYSHVFMVDNDVVVPSYGLWTLLEDDKDVVVGYYPKRSGKNGESCIYKMGEYNFTQTYTVEELKYGETPALFQIHGTGMGCALIKTEVFEKITYPWFDWVNYKNGNNLSEDLYFCKRCKEAEIPIFLDVRVGCGHIIRETKWR